MKYKNTNEVDLVFFIIWGFKTRYKAISEGMFFCSRCGADRPYKQRVGRRWFTLYYIPLFPTGSAKNEHVQCQVCNQAFTLAALQRPTTVQLSSQLLDAVRGAAVHILRAGSIQVPAARECAISEIQKAGLPQYGDAELSADLDVVPGDLSAMYAELNQRLAVNGKEKLVQGVVRIAAADGAVTDLEMTVIKHLGATIGLTAMHVEGICARVGQPAGN
jgi:Tellurite resistance protein TerB